VTDNLLTIPEDAGRAIVEEGAMLARPLLGTDRFIKHCQDRGIALDRERLHRLENLGVFAPVFRVRTPPDDAAPAFRIPLKPDNNWFETGWAWDTTAVPSSHLIPETATDPEHEAYYSVFQLDYLSCVLTALSMRIPLDDFVGPAPVDWQKNGESWLAYADARIEGFRAHAYRRAVALLCQYISNPYYPRTRGDMRTIQTGAHSSTDAWITLLAPNWDWRREAADWDPKKAEALFNLTPEKLAHAYRGLASAQAFCDPLEHWYQLTQFVAVHERDRLKGDALLADTLRSGAHMLRLLHKDLYGEELPHPNETFGTVITHVPELSVREDPRRFLEFVVNRYRLNPQPSLALILEGKSERVALSKIFAEYYGAHPGTFGVEFLVLGGVDNATGSKKEDRFRAILRLVDYLHHHQIFAFLILDNENYAKRLKKEASKAK